jgi:hypothetical protein
MTPHDRLQSLANEAEVLMQQRGSGEEWDWLVVPRIRRLLDRSVDLLADLAEEVDEAGGAEAEARAMLDTRDEVAAHLRAADHVAAARARPGAHTNLLLKAVERLVAEYGVPET